MSRTTRLALLLLPPEKDAHTIYEEMYGRTDQDDPFAGEYPSVITLGSTKRAEISDDATTPHFNKPFQDTQE